MTPRNVLLPLRQYDRCPKSGEAACQGERDVGYGRAPQHRGEHAERAHAVVRGGLVDEAQQGVHELGTKHSLAPRAKTPAPVYHARPVRRVLGANRSFGRPGGLAPAGHIAFA